MGGEEKFVCDIAILGSSLQAALIAGLLARAHKKNVCLVVDPSIQHRLSREINLSVDCITRPQTWEMLSRLHVEACKLFTGIGGGRAVRRINPLFMSTTHAAAEALAHFYHVARGSGHEVEKITLPQLPHVKTALRFRGAGGIERRLFSPPLMRWLLAGTVRLVKSADLNLSFRRDGSGQMVAASGSRIEFERLVFGDEQALCAFARPRSLERLFRHTPMTALLSEPDDRLTERFVINPQNRFCAYGAQGNIIEVLGQSQPDDLGAQVGKNLPGGQLLRRAGQSVFNSVQTRDGAPMVGKLSRGGGWAVAGFGHVGLFMAPAIARFLAGRPTDFEKEYFEARGANASRKSTVIREFDFLRDEARQ